MTAAVLDCLVSCLKPAVPQLLGMLLTGGSPSVRWKTDEQAETDDDASGSQSFSVALTIDDFPPLDMTIQTFSQLMSTLRSCHAKATFFVIWENVEQLQFGQHMLREMVNHYGHEIGVHYKGRWGACMSLHEYRAGAQPLLDFAKAQLRKKIRFMRPAGGNISSTVVDEMRKEPYCLETVIGTSYAFDADLCACCPGPWHGRCIGRTVQPGEIIIIHVGPKLNSAIVALCKQLRHPNHYGRQIKTLESLCSEDYDLCEDAACSRTTQGELLPLSQLDLRVLRSLR